MLPIIQNFPLTPLNLHPQSSFFNHKFFTIFSRSKFTLRKKSWKKPAFAAPNWKRLTKLAENKLCAKETITTKSEREDNAKAAGLELPKWRVRRAQDKWHTNSPPALFHRSLMHDDELVVTVRDASDNTRAPCRSPYSLGSHKWSKTEPISLVFSLLSACHKYLSPVVRAHLRALPQLASKPI